MVRIGILQKMYDLSDKAVIDEIAVNRAYEHFCHLSPLDELPHPSSLCKFRKMRLDENIMDDIMKEIVCQLIDKGIIQNKAGIIVYSTHIHANTVKRFRNGSWNIWQRIYSAKKLNRTISQKKRRKNLLGKKQRNFHNGRNTKIPLRPKRIFLTPLIYF